MIYTVTMNPSLDMIIAVDDFALGKTNRTRTERFQPGGKGINVSRVLHNLGLENVALGFLAGFIGAEIEKKVEALGLRHDFLWLENGCSRMNVKLTNYEGTEINGKGPYVGPRDLERLMGQLDRLGQGDILILSGSAASGVPDTIYGDLMDRLSARGILFVVDAAGALLENALKYHPFLIKPNLCELEALFVEEKNGAETPVMECMRGNGRQALLPYARKLQEQGARNVLISLAGEGAFFLDEDGKAYCLPVPEGKLVNAVGAGDSMVAGFLAGWEQGCDYETAFRMSVAAGSASAYSEDFATKEEIAALEARLRSVGHCEERGVL